MDETKAVYGEKDAGATPEMPAKRHILPTHMHNGKLKTKGINQEGESGRAGIHPKHFFQIAWRNSNTLSKWVNVLWPFVPVAIAVRYAMPERHGIIFSMAYLAMIPCANMVGFAGQELARKMPRVLGIITETTLGSIVEIILFLILATKSTAEYNTVLQAAILGSIMTNLLLCLGFCFLVGGIKNKEQKFHPIVSETGSGILLVAGFALLIPTAFFTALQGATVTATTAAAAVSEFSRRQEGGGTSTEAPAAYTFDQLSHDTLGISHGTAVILMAAFFIFLIYSCFSNHSVFDEILAQDEEMDNDRHRDMAKKKFTLTEAIIAIAISLTFVTLAAVFLVEQIHYIVEEAHIPDAFLGFILVPLVEKLAEHITAIDEAYDNQINFALYHCIGPSIQTALFNAPLAVIVSWGLGAGTNLAQLSLNFEIFMIVILVLSILVVGNFLRDGSSNYLEGALLLIVYTIIALATWYYPNPNVTSTNQVAR